MDGDVPSNEKLSEAQHFIYVTQVYFCSMYAVVLWDWVISLPREWRFVWMTIWTPIKIAYLFCRYWIIMVVPYLLYCFVLDHSLETCERIFKIPVALAMWNQVGSEVVLLIRTYAFFNRNVFVLSFLVSALIGVVAYQLYVDTTQMLLLPFVKPPFDRGPCFPRSKPHSAHLLGFFVAPLLFDTLVTVMTVHRAFTIRRKNGGPNSKLIQTFLREGIFYYLLISAANLINGVFYLQPRQEISAINIPLSVMLGPLFACRLILDLRERGSDTVSHSEGTGIAAFTTRSANRQGSPFTPPAHRSHKSTGAYGRRTHCINTTTTVSSNVLLSTLGSIPPDSVDLELEHDTVEMESGSLSTIGGEDGEPTEAQMQGQGQAPVFNDSEMGLRVARDLSLDDVRRIRIDVEKETSTM